MARNIHPSAYVESSAELGEDVEIGAFSVIGAGAVIGTGTRIETHCHIAPGVAVGSSCRIASSAMLGGDPQDKGYSDQESGLLIGDRVMIGEFATINRGDIAKDGATVVGDDSMVMAYCHIGHNCKLGKSVVLTNQTQLAGHVRIEDFGWLSAAVLVHQFVTIGTMAFVAAKTEVRPDVPPYVIAEGGQRDFSFRTVNVEGLRRRQVPAESIRAVRRTFRQLFHREHANLVEAVEEVRRSELGGDAYVRNFIDHVAATAAGVKNRALEGERARGKR